MSKFKQQLDALRAQIPDGVKIIAVSKTKPVSDILIAFEAGQRAFGENKVQELLAKQPELPSEVEWHLIGHLQTNKIKQVVPAVSMIHSVDSVRLLDKIQFQAEKAGRIISCLLQVHIAQEDTKFGFDSGEVLRFFDHRQPESYSHIRLSGLMGMATFTDNEKQIAEEFRFLRKLFDQVRQGPMSENPDFCELSMGMTSDYRIAVEEGSTMIRIGTLLFGGRG